MNAVLVKEWCVLSNCRPGSATSAIGFQKKMLMEKPRPGAKWKMLYAFIKDMSSWTSSISSFQ